MVNTAIKNVFLRSKIQNHSLNMDKYVVAVINNNEARLFTLEQAEWPEYESGPHLIEQKIVSQSKNTESVGLWSRITGKTGKNSQKSSVPINSYYKFERKFASQITSEIINLVRMNQSKRLILVAQPQILKLAHQSFVPTIFNNLQIRELHKDISHFHPVQIHQYLARKHLIPHCQTVVYPR